jgi:APA family basic amino acid/polyamine antiporter
VKLPGYPVASAVYILIGATILVLAFLERPVESLVAVATALGGIPVYFFFKKSARKGA